MRTTKQITYYLSIIFMCFITVNVQAQVTIGMEEAPAEGALLQLKSIGDAVSNGGANASQGLGMPRMILTNKFDLTDIIDSPSIQDKEEHTGLMVYQTGYQEHATKGLFCPGLYIWNGAEWQRMSEPCIELNIDNLYFDFNSGQDNRGSVASKALNTSWNPAKAALTWTTSALTLDDVPFLTNPIPTSPWTSNPMSLNLLPDAMTTAEVDTVAPGNPWLSKETQMNVVLTNGTNVRTRVITLNQTNYALKVNNGFSNGYARIPALLSTEQKSVPVASNGIWKATVENDDKNIITGISIGSGITGSTTTSGGENLKNSTHKKVDFYYTPAAGGTGTKYATADILFEDTESAKRFKDIRITVTQCQGTLDEATLGAGVQKHTDQSGNTFYSADFGVAGRWMVTNLAAKEYDTRATRTGDDQTIPQALVAVPSYNATQNTVDPLWAFPATNNSSNPADDSKFVDNPFVGLLYTWAAATNSKGGLVDGTDVAGVEFEAGHEKRQGICPNGWHLPNHYEWTELENEINQYTSKYSTIPDITPTNSNSFPKSTAVTYWHGTLHGMAMKDPCEQKYTGASKSPLAGGFAGLLVGRGEDGKAWDFGRVGNFWSSTSSGNSGRTAYRRALNYMEDRMNTVNAERYRMFSVRCKQD